jgi:hypothetical protein
MTVLGQHRSPVRAVGIIRGLDLSFGGGLPRAGDFADAKQPGLFMMMLERANDCRDHGRPCLDPPVIGIHRGMEFAGLAHGIVEIQTDVRMQGDLVAPRGAPSA